MTTNLWAKLPAWMQQHRLAKIPPHTPEEDYHSAHTPVTEIDQAHVITSANANGTHRPVLDLDFPAQLVPSSTPGHYHLYLDRGMSWDRYADLLMALEAAGILEQGYVGASIERGYTSVRLPWIKKEAS